MSFRDCIFSILLAWLASGGIEEGCVPDKPEVPPDKIQGG